MVYNSIIIKVAFGRAWTDTLRVITVDKTDIYDTGKGRPHGLNLDRMDRIRWYNLMNFLFTMRNIPCLYNIDCIQKMRGGGGWLMSRPYPCLLTEAINLPQANVSFEVNKNGGGCVVGMGVWPRQFLNTVLRNWVEKNRKNGGRHACISSKVDIEYSIKWSRAVGLLGPRDH